MIEMPDKIEYTAVLSEAWAKLRDWASVACRGRLLLSDSVAHASLKTAVQGLQGSTLFCALGLVKFVPAVARLIFLALPGSFLNVFRAE